MKKAVLFFILLTQSCGWILDDYSLPEYQSLIGDFKVLTDKNDTAGGKKLVILEKSDEKSGYSWKVIITNCNKIYVDSTKLYVKALQFEDTFNYSEVLCFQNNYDIKTISKSEFEKLVFDCKSCKLYDFKN